MAPATRILQAVPTIHMVTASTLRRTTTRFASGRAVIDARHWAGSGLIIQEMRSALSSTHCRDLMPKTSLLCKLPDSRSTKWPKPRRRDKPANPILLPTSSYWSSTLRHERPSLKSWSRWSVAKDRYGRRRDHWASVWAISAKQIRFPPPKPKDPGAQATRVLSPQAYIRPAALSGSLAIGCDEFATATRHSRACRKKLDSMP